MNYELMKKLKDAGFPQETNAPFKTDGGRLIYQHVSSLDEEGEVAYAPTLSELIEACRPEFVSLVDGNGTPWACYSRKILRDGGEPSNGSTHEEAVANLWLVLNEKKS